MNLASRRRLLVLYAVAAAMLISLGGRLWYLQVMNNTAFTKLAAANQTRSVIVPAVRGQILDDVGNRLVTNQTALVVSVDMMNLSQQPGGAAPVLHRLAPLLGMSYTLLQQKTRLCTKGVPQPCWAGSPYQPIPVAQNVSPRTALQVMEQQKKFPGVTAQVQPVIQYPMPDGANPAQVLGYLQPITPEEIKSRHLPVTGFSGVDLVGQAGLEAQYDSQLRGKAGTQVVSVNAAGDVTGTVSQTAPANGDDLVTSLNAQVQVVAQKALDGAIARSRASGNDANQGAAVVMTTTGRVVAMASYPDYNPSIWTGGISQRQFNALFGKSGGQPIINWTTQGQYAPGSTFKVTSTAAAVADGYPLYGLYGCPGSVTIAGHTFGNDGEPSLGDMTFNEALIQSCDTVYYNLGYDMYLRDNPKANNRPSPSAPVQKMQKMELDWGFGKNTGVDLPEESTGTIPTRQWLYYLWKDNAHTGQNWCKNGKQFGSYVQQIEWQDCQSGWQWEPGQAAIAAIGQGYVTVTPLQLANSYVALANGGTLYSPRIGKALVSPTTGKVVQQINPPVIRHLPVSGQALAYIRHALAGVVTQGTAAGAFGGFPLDKVCVAGKTGTAQLFGKNATSVFASFAPCDHPKYVVLVMVPDSGYGADVAAPAVRQIWDGIFGLEGKKAAVPGGLVPSALPKITSTGAITPPSGYAQSAGGSDAGPVDELQPPRPDHAAARRVRRPPPALPAGPGLRQELPARHMDWILVVVVLGLTAIGTLLIWSATQPGLLAAGQDPRTYLKKQLLNVVIGLVLMIGVSLVDTRQLRTWAPFFYGGTVLALLAVLTPLGSVVNGARAWFSLPGGFQVEPNEFAKIALILVIAMVFSSGFQSRSGVSGGPRVRALFIALGCAAPLIGLVVVEPALGVALVLVVVTATMIVLSGLRLRVIATLTAVVAVIIAAAGGLHLLKDYQLTRFTSFLHPSQDLAGAGYNAAQAKIAVGSGGMFGQGLFHGQLVAGNFVPSQQTDFIFTVAGEELGFVGTIVIVFLLGVVILRALRIATRADDLFGLLVASGIAMWFAFQSFVNIGMTIGIMPITGLPLPFVSYGGSAIFADMIAIGLLQSVHRRRTVFE